MNVIFLRSILACLEQGLLARRDTHRIRPKGANMLVRLFCTFGQIFSREVMVIGQNNAALQAQNFDGCQKNLSFSKK